MANKKFHPNSEESFNQGFRAKRFQFFNSLLEKIKKDDKVITILDIGGTEIYWERMGFTKRKDVHITLLNLEKFDTKYDNFVSVIGDACDLSQYKDGEFDIVYSNSVIEHLFTYENQQKMANETRRVGKYYYIQTPNYFFPIEPHFLVPFFQFFPVGLRVFLLRNFNLGNNKRRKNKEDARRKIDEVKLLSKKQMMKLYPDGEVYKEMFYGFVKSITMYRFPKN